MPAQFKALQLLIAQIDPIRMIVLCVCHETHPAFTLMALSYDGTGVAR